MTRRLTDAEFLEALDDLFVESILAMTPEELRAEVEAEGGDYDALAAEAREAGLRAIREAEGRTPIAWSLDPISPRVEVDMIGPHILVRVPELGASEFSRRYVENREGVIGQDLPAVGSFW